MRAIQLIGMILSMFGLTLARDLPEFLRVCKRSDPRLGDCIKESIENFRPYLKTGLPEYKIPSLEPLMLEEMTATAGSNIRMKLRHVHVYGASNYTIKRMKANMNHFNFNCELFIPNLAVEGEYEADGQIILLRIRGSGPMRGNFTDCKSFIKVQMEKIRGGDKEEYLRVTEIKAKIAVGSGQLHLQNLFGGDEILGRAVNDAINSNFDVFLQELQPALESAISNTFTDIGNSILVQFTYPVLFPDK